MTSNVELRVVVLEKPIPSLEPGCRAARSDRHKKILELSEPGEGTYFMSVQESECERLLRTFDWGTSPLGPMAAWPTELRTLVNVMLGSVQPMFIVWGAQKTTLYNGGYAEICGQRHPRAFGQPFPDIWHDIWGQIQPIMTAAYGGQGTSMTDIELVMHRHGYAEEAHFAFSYTPVRDVAGRVLGVFCACTETTAEVRMRRAEQSQRDRFIQVFELSPGGIAMLSGPDHVFDFANDAYVAMIGASRDIIGRPVAEAVSEVVQQGFIGLLDAVYRSGEPFVARAVPVILNRGPAGEAQERMIDITYQAITDPVGEITGILVQVQDVTDRVAEDRHRELLSHELGHRLKNQLAMVQAIASQTLRGNTDTQVARRVLSERLSILSEAHEAIVRGGVGASNVADIVNRLVTLHDDPGDPHFRLKGLDLKVGSRPALSLSLILHELATNAHKHGSLSVPEGGVALTWGVVNAGARFELVWEECGGPRVPDAHVEGSGAKLIRAGLAGAAECDVRIDYLPEGLRCVVSADLISFQQEH